MRKNKVQPAHKSYFLGQGYKDIGTAIKTSWLKNAQTAKAYYDKYSEKGLMSLKGVYNLFCALSVVSFGTVFFALISAVMVTFVSLFFVLVYIGFSAAWIFDQAYLARKKIFTACNECKCKSLIPTYICPKCGAHLKMRSYTRLNLLYDGGKYKELYKSIAHAGNVGGY